MSQIEQEPVGYRKPPRHGQFKPGQSGNPKGRPRKTKNVEAILLSELDRNITLNESGVERTVTKREALIIRLINGALKGRPKELAILIKIIWEIGPADPIVFTEDDDLAFKQAIAILEGSSPKG